MADFKTISTEELIQKLDNNEDFYFFDVLGPDSYNAAHIPGAEMIDAHEEGWWNEIEDRVKDKDAEIIVYCASPSCQLSPTAADLLVKRGYTNVKDYEGGLKGWAEAGHDFEGEKAEERKKEILES